MLQAVIHGLGLGFMLTILVGPIFFLLIRTSIEQGARSALILDIGVLAGDILYIWLAYIGTAHIFEKVIYAKWLGVTGAFILMFMGVAPLLKKKRNSKEIILEKPEHVWWLIIKGFLINITNPFVIFFWIASMGYAVTTFDADAQKITVYFMACMCCYLFFDLIKIYAAIKIKSFLTPKKIDLVDKIASLGITALGIVLLVRILKMYA